MAAAGTGTIQAPRNELLDIAELVKTLAPLFAGTKSTTSESKAGTTAGTTVQDQDQTVTQAGTTSGTQVTTTGIDPNISSQTDKLIETLLGRAFSTQQTDALVEDIMHRAALAFSPVLGEERAAGGYNSTTRKLLGDEAMARATQASAQAVLDNQTKTIDQIVQLQNQKAQTSSAAAPKTVTTTGTTGATTGTAGRTNTAQTGTTSATGTTNAATPPAISGKTAAIGGLAALSAGPLSDLMKLLNIGSTAKTAKSAYDWLTKPGALKDAGADIAGRGALEEAVTSAVPDVGLPAVSELPTVDAGSSILGPQNFAPGSEEVVGNVGAYNPYAVEGYEHAFQYAEPALSENVASIEQLMQQLGMPQQLNYTDPLVSELIGQVGDLPGSIQFTGYGGGAEAVAGGEAGAYVAEQYGLESAAQAYAAEQAAAAAAAEELAATTAASELAATEAVGAGAGEVAAAEALPELGSQAAELLGGEAVTATGAEVGGIAAEAAAEGGGAAAAELATTAEFDAFASEFAGYGFSEAEIASLAAEQGITQFGAAAAGEVGAEVASFAAEFGMEAAAEYFGAEAVAGLAGGGLGAGAALAGFGEASLGALGAGGAAFGAEAGFATAAGLGAAEAAGGLTLAEIAPILLWVVCTELRSTGELDPKLYEAGAKHLHKVSKTTIRGYHVWAVPYTRWMRRSKLARAIIKPIARGRTRHFAGEWNLIGFLTVWVAEPICWILGKLCKQRNWRELYGTST